jgi:hypothetical protein
MTERDRLQASARFYALGLGLIERQSHGHAYERGVASLHQNLAVIYLRLRELGEL